MQRYNVQEKGLVVAVSKSDRRHIAVLISK